MSDVGTYSRRTRRARDAAAGDSSRASSIALALSVALSAVVWCFWPVVANLVREWRHNEDYSVGELVPFVVLYLFWHNRRKLARGAAVRPCAWGALIVVAALSIRTYALLSLFESGERYALVLAVIGVLIWVLGFQFVWQSRWVMLFMFLMVPLPGQVHNHIAGPLQSWATAGSVYVLELLGVTVTSEGNVIRLNNAVRLAVAEACSGLRMLSAFIVVASTLAFLVRRPPWQRAVLVVSSLPVAVACNILRLVLTALLFMTVSTKTAEQLVHDFAGLSMMPFAVVMLMLELWLLRAIFPDPSPAALVTDSAPARRA